MKAAAPWLDDPVSGQPAQQPMGTQHGSATEPWLNDTAVSQPEAAQASQAPTPAWQPAKTDMSTVPYDPAGQGDIGFNNDSQAQALPPGAQKWQIEMQRLISGGQVEPTPEGIKKAGRLVDAQLGTSFASGQWDEQKLALTAKAMAQGGVPGVITPHYQAPDISSARGQGGVTEHADAFARSAANVVPGADKLAALGDTLQGGDYHSNLNRELAVDEYDWQHHLPTVLAGTLAGGALIPGDAAGVASAAGRTAMREALVAGLPAEEARQVATRAALIASRNYAAKSGAVYGAASGVGNSQGIDEVPGHAVAGAALGGATGAAIGQAGVKFGTRTAEDAPDYIQLARDLSIRRTPATNSGSGVTPVMQAGLGALPGGAPIAQAADREAADLGASAKGVAENIGNISTRQGAGEAIAQGAQQYSNSSRTIGNALYSQRDALIGGSDTPVATDNAASAIQDMSAKFPNSPAIQQLREHPAIRAIGGALPGEPTVENVPTGILDADGNPITRQVTSGGEPLNLGEVTEALSHVRGVARNLAAQSNTTSPVLSRVNQLQQGLKDDVMAAASKADVQNGRVPGAEGSAVKAQQDADQFWADRAQALNGSLKKPIKSANDDTAVSGEGVYNQVSGDMNAKNGNLSRLRDTWFRLPDEAKNTFAATKIDDLGRAVSSQQDASGSAWSFRTFLTNFNNLSPQSRNIVFGAKANEQLQQIATYASRLQQLDRTRNFSNTAQKYFAGAFMATVGGAIMHGDLGSAAEAVMAIPATWGGAKLLLATPAMRDWTAKAMNVMSTRNETGLKVLTANLGQIAAKNPAIAVEAKALQRAIFNSANDNVVVGVQPAAAAVRPEPAQESGQQQSNAAQP